MPNRHRTDRRSFRPRFIFFFIAIASALPSLSGAMEASGPWTLHASDWSRPRSGSAIVNMQPVAAAVRAWRAAAASNPQARLQLTHPGGEEGSLWAAELRDWLVALGLPPDGIEISAGGQPPDQLEIRLL